MAPVSDAGELGRAVWWQRGTQGTEGSRGQAVTLFVPYCIDFADLRLGKQCKVVNNVAQTGTGTDAHTHTTHTRTTHTHTPLHSTHDNTQIS